MWTWSSSGLDPSWPLRLPTGWRLCQVLHYDIKGWYWVLDHDGETVALDTVDDPEGLGRDGIPTDRLIELAERHPETARAAYLTAKRIRKGQKDSDDWTRIGELAAAAPEEYVQALSWIFGDRVASLLTSDDGGAVPPDHVLLRARRVQWLHRRANPARAFGSLWASTRRWYGRITRPSGLFVLVVGPDGSGKSSLADALPQICAGPFRRWEHAHWRPGLLPRAGALLGVAQADPTRPHSQSFHGPLTSLASLGYHWLDFFIGGWLCIAPLKIRSALIVVERGWWDIAIDPRRYRIAAPTALVRVLGWFLPQPDLVIVLEASPEVLTARTSEIGRDEIDRQTRAWRSIALGRTTPVYVDAARPEAEVRATAREAVFAAARPTGIREARARMGGASVHILVALAATARTEKGRAFRPVRLPARHAIRQGGMGGGERHRDRRALPALAERRESSRRGSRARRPLHPQRWCAFGDAGESRGSIRGLDPRSRR